MSAPSRGVRPRIASFLRALFRRPEADLVLADELSNTEIVEAGEGDATCPEVDVAVPSKSRPRANRPGDQNGNGLHLPLQSIISSLPLALRARVKRNNVGDLTVCIKLESILSQLAQGAVKVPFGEIRKAAPQVFTVGSDCDALPVVLPLGEILSRINPALLIRRSTQKQVEVPKDINSPFSESGCGLIFSVGNAKPETPAAPRHTAPAPVPHRGIVPVRSSISTVPPPAEPPTANLPLRHNSPLSPSPEAIQSAGAPVVPVVRLNPSAAPAIPKSPVATPVVETPTLALALEALAEGWPDALRQEIVRSSLVNSTVALPVDLIETSLKRGRVAFTWKVLRSWIRPAVAPQNSAHDAAELELPLNVVAPLFLARQKATRQSHKTTIDEAIPNLFFGFPKAEAPSASVAAAPEVSTAPAPKKTDTNYYVWDDTSEVARVDETEFKRKQPSGSEFVARCATPNEIVSRAAALDGVAGALIALPDGLMVANQIPPELNGDTLAAFLPQIFAKVSQTTKELRMGELNNLNFTVGNVPWKIFRVNAIFFAAFGRAGEPLPTSQLAALAAELDRRKSS